MSVRLGEHWSSSQARAVSISLEMPGMPGSPTKGQELQPPIDVIEVGRVWQVVHDGHVDPPRFSLTTSRNWTREEWRELVDGVDQAFHAFGQRWPASSP